LLNHVTRHLPLLGISPARFAQLLLKRTGCSTRGNFKFGFLSYRESFDLFFHQIRERLGFEVPIVPLIATPADDAAVAARLRDDRTIRCLLTTYLYAERALELARKFERSVIVTRLKPAASAILSPPSDGKRYIIVRDRDFARGFQRLVCAVCTREHGQPSCGLSMQVIEDRLSESPICCDRVCIASLADDDALASITRKATEVFATGTALHDVTRRYGKQLRVHPLPTEVADETLDDILFHYLFDQRTTSPANAELGADWTGTGISSAARPTTDA
jgi:hypothetical protein